MTPDNKSEPSGPTLLLVDDHPVVREGLRSLLEERTSCRVVGEANNGREAIELCDRHQPDLVLMDITMPELNGIEATRQIVQTSPHIGVVVQRSCRAVRLYPTSTFDHNASETEILPQSVLGTRFQVWIRILLLATNLSSSMFLCSGSTRKAARGRHGTLS